MIMKNRSINKREIFVRICNIGFVFKRTKGSCCNYISPMILEFFSQAKKQDKPIADFVLPSFEIVSDEVFTDEFDEYIKLQNLKFFRYIGKRLVLCSDGKFRNCRHYKITFKEDDSEVLHTDLFACDISLTHKKYRGVAGVLKV